MKLRTHIYLIVGLLSAAFVGLVISAELDSTRNAVREEIAASNVVAGQILKGVVTGYAHLDASELTHFLETLGRVRANEIVLYAPDRTVLYRSPASTYKAGREAPQWFAALLAPPEPAREFTLADGARLTVTANASRAILDGWDQIAQLLLVGALTLGALNGLVFWLVNRALSPLPIIGAGLRRLRQGELHYRLPPLRGVEAAAIGAAFNEMASAVEDKVQAERLAREAQTRLEERRELSQLIEQRLEEERRMIARELHDEFAQSVTAIRSLALSIAAQAPRDNAPIREATALIDSEAARLYDAMHGLIPRLTPLTLDTLGLADTLQHFIDDWQRRNPTIALSLHQRFDAQLGPSIALTIYRIVQEALINAVRHAQPKTIEVTVACDAQRVAVRIADDGVGLPADWSRPGRFGLRGLHERVAQLHGGLRVANRPQGGVEVSAEIPLTSSATP